MVTIPHQGDPEKVTMALVKPHEDAIDVAPIDALYALSNETGRAEAYHSSDAG
jgi:hypothetical protein